MKIIASCLVLACFVVALPDVCRAAQGGNICSGAATPQQRDAMKTVLHPGALARVIDDVGGREVLLPRARVVAVLNRRVFLIESASALPPLAGHADRVLVLIESGALRVDAAALVQSNVRVLGVARTPLGIQTTREVPWPPELTRDRVKRYGIRAAVLASSVQTADCVELTNRP